VQLPYVAPGALASAGAALAAHCGATLVHHTPGAPAPAAAGDKHVVCMTMPALPHGAAARQGAMAKHGPAPSPPIPIGR
jgi:hypothetical protein